MSGLGTLRVALLALFRNPMRSALTALGVIIGVASVIAMVSIGQGARAQFEAALAAMGTNMLTVNSGSASAGGFRFGFGSLPTLTWADLDAIHDLPVVRYAAVQLRTNATVQGDGASWSTTVIGTSPDFLAMRDWKVESGQVFGEGDLDASRTVVLLGRTVSDALFGAADPVGASVRIRGVPFEVGGVLAKKGESATGQDLDDTAIVPQTTFRARLQAGFDPFIGGSITVGCASPEDTSRAIRQIGALLRDRHRRGEDQEDDFSIRNQTETASARNEGTRTLTTLLATIAAVSLVVGGIGIMNIMLVSVTERTREIGLRMAVGARPRDVLLQFLVESLALSVGGGALGVLIGWVAAWRLAAWFGWPMVLEPGVVGLAVGTSVFVGVVFGLYPAWVASRLDPIVALRSE